MTTKTIKTQKTSVVKQAAWNAVLDVALIITNTFDLIKNQITFGPEDYQTLIPIPMLLSLITLLLMIGVLIIAVNKTKNAEKDDELSKLHRYKAGYISKYVLVLTVIIAIWIIKDFSFAFTEDFFGNLMNLPLIILMFAEFVENITFIILEKRSLE